MDLQRHLPADFRNLRMFYKTPSQGVASFLVAALDPALKCKLALLSHKDILIILQLTRPHIYQ